MARGFCRRAHLEGPNCTRGDTGEFSSTPTKDASPGHPLVCTHRKPACTWRLSKLRCSLGRGLQAATLASLRPRRVQIASSTLQRAHRARAQHLPRLAMVIPCAIAVASFQRQRGSVLRDDVSCRQHLMHALLECPTACVRIRVRESCATCVCARARSCARQSGSDASRGGTVGHREHKGPWQTVGHREHKGPWQPSGSLGGNDYG